MSMFIGSLQLDLFLPGVLSLKEKRFALKSIKTKLKNKFNISVAEVDFNDKWQRSRLGVVCVANDRRFIDEILSKVINLVELDGRVEITDQCSEIF